MHNNNDSHNQDDSELFRQAVADARPLNTRHLTRITRTNKKLSQPVKTKIPEKTSPIILAEEDFAHCDAEEILFFAPADLPHKAIKKLRTGKLAIQSRLDLHGMKINQARSTLENFLSICQQQNIRSTLIIHGKGAAILKCAVNTWLRNYQHTLAFCSAQQKDGGSGALYLLLRK